MKAKLVSIGNSKGIRLPSSLIKQYQLDGDVELDIQKDCIIIRPNFKQRANWEAAFDKMHKAGDDQLLDEGSNLSEWDETEWTW